MSYVYIEQTFRELTFPQLNLSRKAKYYLNKSLLVLLFLLVLSISLSFSFLQRSTPEYKAQDYVATEPLVQNLNQEIIQNDPQLSQPPDGSTTFIQKWTALLQSSLKVETVPANMKPQLSNLKNSSEYWKNCFAKINTIPCTYGNSNAEPSRTAIVYGDSYAISALPAILSSLDLKKWRVDVLVFGECMIADVTPLRNGKAIEGCNSYRNWAITYILEHEHSILFLAHNPDTPIADSAGTIISLPGTTMNPYWVKQMTASIQKLQSEKTLMVIVGSPPQPLQSLGQCVTNELKIGKGCFAKSGSRSGPRILERSLAQKNSDVFVDLEKVLCHQGVCSPVIDGTAVFYDGSHISYEMAIRIAPFFKEQLSKNPKFANLTK
jgi:hypothetical protein